MPKIINREENMSVNVPVPGPPDGIFDLKFHQLAMYVPDLNEVKDWWQGMGYFNWLPDNTLLRGTLHDRPYEVYEELLFNYELWPHEMEYIHYNPGHVLPGDERGQTKPWISHWATYVEDLDAKLLELHEEYGLHPYFLYTTIEHENPDLNKSGLRFYECLINTRRILGHDLKLIQRVYPGGKNHPDHGKAVTVNAGSAETRVHAQAH